MYLKLRQRDLAEF